VRFIPALTSFNDILRQRMTEDMQVRNLALNTQECYLVVSCGIWSPAPGAIGKGGNCSEDQKLILFSASVSTENNLDAPRSPDASQNQTDTFSPVIVRSATAYPADPALRVSCDSSAG
jgi:hypothetical protein